MDLPISHGCSSRGAHTYTQPGSSDSARQRRKINQYLPVIPSVSSKNSSNSFPNARKERHLQHPWSNRSLGKSGSFQFFIQSSTSRRRCARARQASTISTPPPTTLQPPNAFNYEALAKGLEAEEAVPHRSQERTEGLIWAGSGNLCRWERWGDGRGPIGGGGGEWRLYGASWEWGECCGVHRRRRRRPIGRPCCDCNREGSGGRVGLGFGEPLVSCSPFLMKKCLQCVVHSHS